MHSSTLSSDVLKTGRSEAEILLSISTLITEGRIAEKTKSSRGFREGPHCFQDDPDQKHLCDSTNNLCANYAIVKEQVFKLWSQNIPICIEVILTCGCQDGDFFLGSESIENYILLETWNFNITNKRVSSPSTFQLSQLVSAIKSQLYFSQITAWLITQEDATLSNKNLRYRFGFPGETYENGKFMTNSVEHIFPSTEIDSNNRILNVSFSSLPRISKLPTVHCPNCVNLKNVEEEKMDEEKLMILDDRMHMFCTLNGKHHCEDFEEIEHANNLDKIKFKRFRQNSSASTSEHRNDDENIDIDDYICDYTKEEDKSRILLEAIERVGLGSPERIRISAKKCECDNNFCDTNSSSKINKFNKYCDNTVDGYGIFKQPTNRRITFENAKKNHNNNIIPSAFEKAKFRKNLDNAASMVFHSRTGLPLTSSPAPVRKGKTCFDYDSTINSVSSIKNALFSSSFSTDDDSESDGSLVSPCSPETYLAHRVKIEDDNETQSPIRFKNHRKGRDSSLLGSFEESVLNGRLEPVSTVHGFKAELGASGSFVPKHSVIPVTVFFYTLGDNDKISSPYLCHINLGKKGYYVPKRGTVQVTLFNPLGTVVKMFVIMYDLSDMPANSQTFIRQRTLYMPNECQNESIEWGPKWLKYLIHLRFSSSKSGKIYLHKDIRMIIIHKSDLDTATAHSLDMCYELRSFTIMPTNPRFSPRK